MVGRYAAIWDIGGVDGLIHRDYVAWNGILDEETWPPP
jgi:ribosomal protein S1